MNALTQDLLAAIKERADKATPGPWTLLSLEVMDSDEAIRIADFETLGDSDEEYDQMRADAEFTALAREDVPALLAEVERLRTKDRNGLVWEGRLAGNLFNAQDALNEAAAEIERLRAGLTELADRLDRDAAGDYEGTPTKQIRIGVYAAYKETARHLRELLAGGAATS